MMPLAFSRAAARCGAALVLCLAIAGSPPAVGQGSLSAELDPRLDQRLEETLLARYQQIEGLEGLQVEVTAGVVTLEGEALGLDSLRQAEDIARRTEGVAEVLNRVGVSSDVSQRLGPAKEKLEESIRALIAFLPLLAVALFVFSLFYLLARWLGRPRAIYERLLPNRLARDVLRRIVRVALLVLGTILALDLLDATALVGAVLGTAGVVGLAVGFAFQGMAENYIASILLSFRQPFAPNDLVQIGDHEGKVMRLTSRATILMTLDGNHLRIPNAEVYKGVILNYSRNPLRRFQFGVNVGVQEDLGEARDIGVGILRDMDGVANDPPPVAVVDELGDSSVVMRFFGWVDQRTADFTKVQSEAIREVKTALDDAGIDLPEPIYRVRLEGGADVGSAQAQRREAVAGEPPSETQGEAPTSKPSTAKAKTTGRASEHKMTEFQEQDPSESEETVIDRQIAKERAREDGNDDLLEPGARLE